MRRILLLAFVVIMIAPLLLAQYPGPKVIDRDWLAYGRDYAGWVVAWNQWNIATPVATHPLFDNGDCSVGQSGPVWFLGGKMCALNSTNCGTSGVVRYCKVPVGKALFVNVMDAELSTLETGIASTNDLHQAAAGYIDTTSVAMWVDGAPIPKLKERFRVQPEPFGFTLPADNEFTAIGEGDFAAGTYYPGVDDGIFVMLSPLPAGNHKIHFKGYMPAFNFSLDITYIITVAK